ANNVPIMSRSLRYSRRRLVCSAPLSGCCFVGGGGLFLRLWGRFGLIACIASHPPALQANALLAASLLPERAYLAPGGQLRYPRTGVSLQKAVSLQSPTHPRARKGGSGGPFSCQTGLSRPARADARPPVRLSLAKRPFRYNALLTP